MSRAETSPAMQRVYTPAEVAQMFRVDPKTVTRWSKSGKLPAAFRTPGNHRRYNADLIDALLRGAAS